MLEPTTTAALIGAGGMMGASALSGGGGGSSGAVSAQTAEQKALLKALIGQIQPELGRGVTPYQGERVPGIQPLQQQGFDIMQGFMPNAGQFQDFTTQALSQYDPAQGMRAQELGAGALENVLKPFDPSGATEMWEKSWKQPALNMWRDEVMPSIMEKGVRKGGTADSGPMKRELARSGEDLTTNLSAQLANLLYSGEQAQMGRQMQGLPEAYRGAMTPTDVLGQKLQIGQYPLNIMNQALQVGGQQQQQVGAEHGAAQQEWTEGQAYENPWLQYLSQALGTQAISPYYKQSGPGAGALGLGALGSAMGSEGFWNMIQPAGAGVAAPTIGGLNNPMQQMRMMPWTIF